MMGVVDCRLSEAKFLKMFDEIAHKLREVFHVLILIFYDVLSAVEVMNSIHDGVHGHCIVEFRHKIKFQN